MQKRQAPRWDPESAPTYWINQASRSLMRRFEERLRPFGFGMAYLPVALALEALGPLQQKDLLDHVRIGQPTMTALLTRMERDRLIERKADPTDARARLVSLTQRGRAVLAQVKTELPDSVDEALVGVDEEDRNRLIRTLKIIINNLANGPVALALGTDAAPATEAGSRALTARAKPRRRG